MNIYTKEQLQQKPHYELALMHCNFSCGGISKAATVFAFSDAPEPIRKLCSASIKPAWLVIAPARLLADWENQGQESEIYSGNGVPLWIDSLAYGDIDRYEIGDYCLFVGCNA